MAEATSAPPERTGTRTYRPSAAETKAKVRTLVQFIFETEEAIRQMPPGGELRYQATRDFTDNLWAWCHSNIPEAMVDPEQTTWLKSELASVEKALDDEARDAPAPRRPALQPYRTGGDRFYYVIFQPGETDTIIHSDDVDMLEKLSELETKSAYVEHTLAVTKQKRRLMTILTKFRVIDFDTEVRFEAIGYSETERRKAAAEYDRISRMASRPARAEGSPE